VNAECRTPFDKLRTGRTQEGTQDPGRKHCPKSKGIAWARGSVGAWAKKQCRVQSAKGHGLVLPGDHLIHLFF